MRIFQSDSKEQSCVHLCCIARAERDFDETSSKMTIFGSFWGGSKRVIFGVKKGLFWPFSKVDFFPTICPSIFVFLGGRCGDLRRDPPKRGPRSRFWLFFPYYLPVYFSPYYLPVYFWGSGRPKSGFWGFLGGPGGGVKKGPFLGVFLRIFLSFTYYCTKILVGGWGFIFCGVFGPLPRPDKTTCRLDPLDETLCI